MCYNHPGNQRFRSIVASLKTEYAHTEQRWGKSLVIRKVVDGIRSKRGRFIKVDPHSFRVFEVGSTEAVSRNNQRQLMSNSLSPTHPFSEKKHRKLFVTLFRASIGQAMLISTGHKKWSGRRLCSQHQNLNRWKRSPGISHCRDNFVQSQASESSFRPAGAPLKSVSVLLWHRSTWHQ